ncbi:TetR/AcrR family transcriptional regulator [Paraburkholderia caledonica]|uniref:TetR/AcrR family transcriptional repressor of nem operon n=1 Tax=Paraburkholderia caledonica TaxID=134536 RepID=A0ABU1KZ07_9BURK|nr:TetR family transcriptional regulator C-terminal domain-containing protein [Paraburkholderia caledonica]MDR6376137.1 TetR/AcrR family transcriptional repressor of nem operon [Paraburkholderia caledonica]
MSTDSILSTAGLRKMRRTGYHATGLQSILDAAELPKGSFYHFFGSKQAFAARVLTDYFEEHKREFLLPFLNDTTLTPRERLIGYFQWAGSVMEKGKFRCGCFVGNIALETADTSPVLQRKVRDIFAEWRSLFSDCIADGQQTRNISAFLPPEPFAEFLLSSWEGALLRSKSDRSAVPLASFLIVTERLLAP